MRRKNDGWVNATHILKVANFDKPQRTRILEKEVQKGIHEKIQGGYGEYQGTWVPLDVARELAFQYNVDSILQPIFDFRESSTSPPPQVKRSGKPKLPKAPAASRPKPRVLKTISPAVAGRALSTSTLGDAPHSSNRKAKKLASYPTDPITGQPIPKRRGRPPKALVAAQAAQAAAQAAIAVGSGSADLVKHSKSGKTSSKYSMNKIKRSAHSTHINSNYEDQMSLSADSDSVSSRLSSPSDSLSEDDLGSLEHPTPRSSGLRQEITDTPTLNKGLKRRRNEEYSRSSGSNEPAYTNKNSNIMICDNELIAAQYGRKLLDYFMAPEDDEIPDYLIHPPEGFNINHVIDDEGHTAFHWACSMGNLKIIIALLDAGANMNAVNLLGQTPLMRTVMFTNSYDLRSFAKIVELLRETIFQQDNAQRTVLHHIADSTSPRSKLSSARYYTEIFLSKLSETEPMSLVESFVNRQDSKGDTALHIAARNEAKKCVKVLTSYHASTRIPNKSGTTPQDYINGYEVSRQKSHTQNSRSQYQEAPAPAPTVAPVPQPEPAVPASNTYGEYPDHAYPQYQHYPSGNTTAEASNNITKPNSSPTHAYTHVYSYDPTSTPAADVQNNGAAAGSAVANGRSEKRYNNNNQLPMSTPPANKTYYDNSAYDETQSISVLIGRALANSNKQTHSSEASGILVNKTIPLVVEKLEQLTKIYDTALLDKKTDAEQVRQLYENIKDDVKSTELQIQEHLANHGDEANAEKESKEVLDLVNERIEKLSVIVDRSQARDLADLVKIETEKLEAQHEVCDEQDHDSIAALALELQELQQRRQNHVQEILSLWSTAGADEKMHKYRRLVATACGVKIEEIDQLLGEIEQVLSETPKNGANSHSAAIGGGAASSGLVPSTIADSTAGSTSVARTVIEPGLK